MSKNARRELLGSLIPSYKSASRSEKEQVLDQFTNATGYSRKYAVTLLGSDGAPEQVPKRKRKTTLDEECLTTLILLWNVANRICGKRLVQAIPVLLDNLETHGHIRVSDKAKQRLLTLSAATIDRALKNERSRAKRSLSLTRRSSLVKNKIPVRTFSEWNDVVPGFFEIDTVGHCSSDPGGAYLHTLNMTDIATCWTIPIAMRRKTARDVLRALEQCKSGLPFPLLGLDFDNGSEFINDDLVEWSCEHRITYTRSREYKKNDQAWIEEKNRSVVRKTVGRARFEGEKAFQKLSELYSVISAYFNFFLPCQKLVSKERVGSKTLKRHDKAQTPYERVLRSLHVSPEAKEALTKQYAALDVMQLYERRVQLQDELRKLEVEVANPIWAAEVAQRNATHKFVAAMRACEAPTRPLRTTGLPARLRALVTSLEVGTLLRPKDFTDEPYVARALGKLAQHGMLERVEVGLYRVTGVHPQTRKNATGYEKFIESLDIGAQFRLDSLSAFASSGTINCYLSRLVRRGVLKRVGRGIYEKQDVRTPKIESLVRK